MRHLTIKFLFTAVFVAMSLIFTGQATAQANLSGTVVDDSTQQAISDVEVKIEALNQSATTDSDGNYEFEFLQPGTHTISVNTEGYKNWSREIEIIDEPKEMDIHLKKQEESQE